LRATSQGPACYVDLLDQDGNYVIRDAGSGRLQGELEVPVARLWWPYLMDPEPGYMYTLQVLQAFKLKFINSLPCHLISM
jgi:beta-glucuronidase